MSLKLSLCLVITASLACVGQVTTMGGYAATSNAGATTVAVYPADAPLVSTPDVALPGSGPAVGAPITTSNDSRTSTGPSVANPNLALLPGLQNGGQPVVGTNTANANNASSGFEFGIQTFVSGLPGASNSGLSLAQIAAQNRAQRRKAAKSFNNGSIAQLNAAGVRTGNLEPGSTTTAASGNAPTNAIPPGSGLGAGTLVARNETLALPQSDQTDQLPRSQPVPRSSATAAQQRHPVAEASSPSSNAPSSNVSAPGSTPAQSSSASAPLPQTASSLPLILLVGALGIAGGALYLLRR